MKTNLIASGVYPILPPWMDSPFNHPGVLGTTRGAAVFLLKCIFLGTRFDTGFVLNGVFCQQLEDTIKSFQQRSEIGVDGNFGQATRERFQINFGINLDSIPHTLLATPDLALQPGGDLLMWPPAGMIVSADTKLRTGTGEYRMLPTYLDYPGAHANPIGETCGPSVLVLKFLFLGTALYKNYAINTRFCRELALTIADFQRSNQTEADSCFGQDTRRCFAQRFGRDLEAIPRSVLLEATTAIQPNGSVIAWPPAITIS